MDQELDHYLAEKERHELMDHPEKLYPIFKCFYNKLPTGFFIISSMLVFIKLVSFFLT